VHELDCRGRGHPALRCRPAARVDSRASAGRSALPVPPGRPSGADRLAAGVDQAEVIGRDGLDVRAQPADRRRDRGPHQVAGRFNPAGMVAVMTALLPWPARPRPPGRPVPAARRAGRVSVPAPRSARFARRPPWCPASRCRSMLRPARGRAGWWPRAAAAAAAGAWRNVAWRSLVTKKSVIRASLAAGSSSRWRARIARAAAPRDVDVVVRSGQGHGEVLAGL